MCDAPKFGDGGEVPADVRGNKWVIASEERGASAAKLPQTIQQAQLLADVQRYMVDTLDIDRETRGLDCTDDPSGSPGPSYAAAPPCLAAVERLTRGASDVQRTLTSCTAAPCLGDHSKRGDRRPRPYALAVDLVLTSARGVAIVHLVHLVHLVRVRVRVRARARARLR